MGRVTAASLVLTALLHPAHARSQSEPAEPPPAAFEVQPASGEIEIDARLDEPAWKEATVIPLPYEWFPGDNIAPPVESECRITYDQENLYLGCLGRDPQPDAIRAHLHDRDDGFEDDHFVLLIDPFNDQRGGYQFRITALGVQMDALFGQQSEDFSWDAIWEAEGRITDEGFVVEAAIPFNAFRFPDTEGTRTWGLFIERSWPRSARHRIGSHPRDRDNACVLCQFNTVTGFTGIDPGLDIELAPTLTARRVEERPEFPAGDLETADEDLEPGLTARWGLTSSLTLLGTANPDFSQVEADAAQLDVNTRFALFFPEKRPFFLEGSDAFDLPATLVFTRTVADPIAGVKLTGKEGPHTIGAFATRDRINNLIFPGPQGSSQTSLSQEVSGLVARYRRDIGGSSTVGLLYTGREAEGYYNRLGAVDGFLRLSPSQSLQFLYTYARTRYPDSVAAKFDQDSGGFGGSGAKVAYGYQSRDWFGGATYVDVARNYRADSGFVPLVGNREVGYALERIFRGASDRWFNDIRVGTDGSWSEDRDGRLLDREVEIGVSYQGPWQSFVRLESNWNRTAFAGEVFDLVRPIAIVEVRPTGAVLLGFFSNFGDQIDFANVRKADNLVLNPFVTLRIGRPLTLAADHNYQRLSLSGEEIFTANLTQLRAVYHFNVRTFVRAIVQYRDVDRNPALHEDDVEPEARRWFNQLLFSYKLNPQTVFFVGYADTRQGATEFDLTQSDRTFFVKLGYAWRL
ncbi:MAG TPA: DUF5916 domain-containing protein [Gemmatimonadota bacterium]|nr:DUF5916 domain-containing protein [Gemmatimonadota bacterium]